MNLGSITMYNVEGLILTNVLNKKSIILRVFIATCLLFISFLLTRNSYHLLNQPTKQLDKLSEEARQEWARINKQIALQYPVIAESGQNNKSVIIDSNAVSVDNNVSM